MMDNELDGNVAGGILGEIFPFDMTSAIATCARCESTDRLGALIAYTHNMGTVLWCRCCQTPLIRVTHIRDRYWMDMRGMRALQIGENR